MNNREVVVKYPHMRADEADIWTRFLATTILEGWDFSYDDRVGEGIQRDPAWTEEIAQVAQTLTQKRIDVVARKGDRTIIIEIKRRAGPGAIGQLLVYQDLWMMGRKVKRIPELMIVCEECSFDMQQTLRRFSIDLVRVIPEAEGEG